MKISVICPTYNSENFVEKTLKSVINQTYLPQEIILIDDGSSDNTIQILEEFKKEYQNMFQIQIIKSKHNGPGKARNIGIENANNEWLAFLDSDDIWWSNKLEMVEASIKKNKNINFICHDEMLVKINGDKKEMLHSSSFNNNLPLKRQLYYANFISTSTVVCNKKLLNSEHSFFDESLMSAQDYELWLRLSSLDSNATQKINLLFIKEILGEYVERKGNITSGKLFSRLKNDIKISLKHRKDIPIRIVFLRFLRIFLSYFKQLIFRIF